MKRVLIAEDEAAIREFVVINLRRGGYEVVEAQDGAEALEQYDACGGDIDIAVLDVMMPNVDGLEVCIGVADGLTFFDFGVTCSACLRFYAVNCVIPSVDVIFIIAVCVCCAVEGEGLYAETAVVNFAGDLNCLASFTNCLKDCRGIFCCSLYGVCVVVKHYFIIADDSNGAVYADFFCAAASCHC